MSTYCFVVLVLRTICKIFSDIVCIDRKGVYGGLSHSVIVRRTRASIMKLLYETM